MYVSLHRMCQIQLLAVADRGAGGAVFYAETRPPVLWTGKTKCGRVLICLDGSGRVKKKYHVSSTYDCSERFTECFTRHVIVILYRHVYIS